MQADDIGGIAGKRGRAVIRAGTAEANRVIQQEVLI